MFSKDLKKKLACTAAATAAVAGIALASNTPVNADPKQNSALVGVGSDTTQDVHNALAGFSNGINFTPLQSSSATGQRQIVSWDANDPSGGGALCFTPKSNGVSTNRPNGSGKGRIMLSRAIDGTGYGDANCGGVQDVSGLVEFARSSSQISSTTGALTHIPFGRDGVSFGYYRASGGAPVTTLTRAQLTSLFSTGAQVINGVNIIPCGIQTGSGTYTFWNTAANVNATQENTATTPCNNLLGTGVRAQENDAADLKARGDLVAPGSQVIIGFSAGSYIAKSNGVATPNPQPLNVGIGSISDNGSAVNLGSPITGTAPNLAPSSTFYADTIFGRKVFNVFDSNVIDNPGNAALKSIFVGAGSTLCTSTTTINTFGFLVAPDCGVTTIRGALNAGTV